MKSKIYKTKLRVQYSQTDKMQYVHHSQYLIYYENARWDLFRKLGICYSEIEKSGILMPVISSRLCFCKPAYYDEELIILTKVKTVGARLSFTHRILNKSNEVINKAEIQIAFVSSKSRKPIKPNLYIIDTIRKFV